MPSSDQKHVVTTRVIRSVVDARHVAEAVAVLVNPSRIPGSGAKSHAHLLAAAYAIRWVCDAVLVRVVPESQLAPESPACPLV